MFMHRLASSQCQLVIVPNKCKSHASNRNSSFWVNLWLKPSWTVEWYVLLYFDDYFKLKKKRKKKKFSYFKSNLQLDLPFSIPFYRWLLYEDSSLGLSDLSAVAPEVQTTLKRLQNIVRERDEVLANPAVDSDTKNAKVILEA